MIDTLTPKTGQRSENNTAVRAEPVWDRAAHPGSWRAVWAYAAKRAARDAKTLTTQENRARAVIAGEKNHPHAALTWLTGSFPESPQRSDLR